MNAFRRLASGGVSVLVLLGFVFGVPFLLGAVYKSFAVLLPLFYLALAVAIVWIGIVAVSREVKRTRSSIEVEAKVQDAVRDICRHLNELEAGRRGYAASQLSVLRINEELHVTVVPRTAYEEGTFAESSWVEQRLRFLEQKILGRVAASTYRFQRSPDGGLCTFPLRLEPHPDRRELKRVGSPS